MNHQTLQKESNSIKNQISAQGYSLVKLTNPEEFKSLCELIGRVPQYTEVRLQKDKNQYPYVVDAVPFHTDNPKMPIVGWYCIRQDPKFGESFIMDGRNVLKKMTKAERNLLAGQSLKMPSRDEQHPLLLQTSPPHLFYVPFHWLQASTTMELKTCQAVLRFHKLVLAEQVAKRFQSIRLQPGEALFIDNRIMIHGRGRLTKNSDRFLIRAFIE